MGSFTLDTERSARRSAAPDAPAPSDASGATRPAWFRPDIAFLVLGVGAFLGAFVLPFPAARGTTWLFAASALGAAAGGSAEWTPTAARWVAWACAAAAALAAVFVG